MIAQKLQILRRLERGRRWRQVIPSYKVRHKRSETDLKKKITFGIFTIQRDLYRRSFQKQHAARRQSFHSWRHCWKSSAMRSCSTTVTALLTLPIISKCPHGCFLIVRKKKIQMGTHTGKAVAVEPPQCSWISKNSLTDNTLRQGILSW